jgi:hypothetical protein
MKALSEVRLEAIALRQAQHALTEERDAQRAQAAKLQAKVVRMTARLEQAEVGCEAGGRAAHATCCRRRPFASTELSTAAYCLRNHSRTQGALGEQQRKVQGVARQLSDVQQAHEQLARQHGLLQQQSHEQRALLDRLLPLASDGGDDDRASLQWKDEGEEEVAVVEEEEEEDWEEEDEEDSEEEDSEEEEEEQEEEDSEEEEEQEEQEEVVAVEEEEEEWEEEEQEEVVAVEDEEEEEQEEGEEEEQEQQQEEETRAAAVPCGSPVRKAAGSVGVGALATPARTFGALRRQRSYSSASDSASETRLTLVDNALFQASPADAAAEGSSDGEE